MTTMMVNRLLAHRQRYISMGRVRNHDEIAAFDEGVINCLVAEGRFDRADGYEASVKAGELPLDGTACMPRKKGVPR